MFEIETNRLLLRKFRPGDEDDAFEFCSDEQCSLDDEGTHAFTEKNDDFLVLFTFFVEQNRYAIVLKSENKVIGIISLIEAERAVPSYEIGFLMNRAYHRRGYCYEAAQAVISEWFARTDTKMFLARHFPYNEASRNLLRKLGFTYEGTQHNAMNHAILGPVDLVCYYKEKEQ